ncbi:MAG: Lipopolysaccharide biosynthesis glycosyltransferase [Candidatus Roizmanbacteria bacterium GW2011_GWA2_35_8]|uniref:Lipopolysaccharide biosynthesis glycosyltransferase n=1 Tax=Candidatus Roizmanbacteria bacterium GW2011_GWA2_35_8 TaxID=1618479 RepID=A0A0G0G5I0_9BACT|nr:MAG: Lipopolysaccharide biosynthesis glycosyltransferase [Candidatus Roizmanbacteria bacterium GW2011_GWA2_35_8]
MNKISAIIVVKDNPPYIFKTLDSIADFVSEIVIVDIGIDISLIEKLKKNKLVKLVKIQGPVPYVEKIREKTKELALYEHILFLDPDEVVQPELKKIILGNYLKYDYFKIPRKNLIFGRFIKHSRWWPDYQIRFFKKNSVKWPLIIHRQPKVTGQGYEIEPNEGLSLLHYNYQNLDEYLSKAQRYAKYEAKEFVTENQTISFSQTVRRSLNEFVSRYFASDGYKDGVEGFVLAFLQMFYYFLVYFYYLETKEFKSGEKIKEEEFFRIGLKESLHWKRKKSIKDKLIKKLL